MSSLFSYELDESQIRLTLQNAKAVDYRESAWDDFEANFVQHHSHSTLNKFKLPEFNLNINRNIVLPIIFIAGLVGVSAIMLSFVDFKTNSQEKVEKSLMPDPDNFKVEETKTSAIVKKEVPKQEPEKAVIKKDSIPVKSETPIVTPPVKNSLANNSVSPDQIAATVNSPVQAKVSVPDTVSSERGANSTIISPNTQNYTGHKRKRRRKVPTDQIETIKAPSLLEQEASAKEPELELKLN